jgi:uncharacterized protein DUF6069
MEEQGYALEFPRVLWAAVITTATAVVAVLAVREVAVRLLHPDPAFDPLTLAPPIVDTIVCTGVAIFVFVRIVSYPDPVRTWRRLAAVVLLLSFIPDVLLATSHGTGAGWPEASVLMTMHVVVWAICVMLLPSLAITKHARRTQASDRPLSIL